jgi:hypothetical protein
MADDVKAPALQVTIDPAQIIALIEAFLPVIIQLLPVIIPLLAAQNHPLLVHVQAISDAQQGVA